MALPYGFSAAVALFRQTLRTVPRSMLVSSAVEYFQPVINQVGFPSLTLPADVTLEKDVVAGVPGEWHLPKDGDDNLLLWAHGGGFMFCSPGTHRHFLARVAERSKCAIFCPDYKKPPNHPFPSPGLDILKSFEALHCPQRRIFLGGDSAGGNLAIEVTRKVSEEGPKPAGLVLLSPWVDLADTSSQSWIANKDIDFIPAEQARIVAEIYAGATPLEEFTRTERASGSQGGYLHTQPEGILTRQELLEGIAREADELKGLAPMEPAEYRRRQELASRPELAETPSAALLAERRPEELRRYPLWNPEVQTSKDELEDVAEVETEELQRLSRLKDLDRSQMPAVSSPDGIPTKTIEHYTFMDAEDSVSFIINVDKDLFAGASKFLQESQVKVSSATTSLEIRLQLPISTSNPKMVEWKLMLSPLFSRVEPLLTTRKVKGAAVSVKLMKSKVGCWKKGVKY